MNHPRLLAAAPRQPLCSRSHARWLSLVAAAWLAAPAAFAQEEPLAGYAHGSFFLRSENDEFVLIPHGRLQVDTYLPFRGDNASARLTEPTILVRRARPELNGTLLKHIDFQIAGDWTNGPVANAAGLSDAWIAIELLPWMRLQLGQHDAPFTLENRISDKYIDFMERSFTVRNLGAPLNKETGAWLWGLLPRSVAYYSAGVFNGSGPVLKNQDGRWDVLARGWLAPFALAGYEALSDVTLGGSFWYGSRGNSNVALPNATTQSGYPVLLSQFSAGGQDARLYPRRNQVKWAVEADLPIQHRYGLRFELVHADLGMDELDAQLHTLRQGNLVGTSFYVQAWWYIFGSDNVVPRPGLQIPPRMKPYVQELMPQHALQVVARYERYRVDYSNDGSLPASADPAVGSYGVDIFELGVNYWATKHLRFTLNYALNHLSGSAGQLAGASGRPIPGSDYLHELLLRVAIAL